MENVVRYKGDLSVWFLKHLLAGFEATLVREMLAGVRCLPLVESVSKEFWESRS